MEKYLSSPILVVDDEEYIRDLVARILAIEGYSSVTASSGEEAVKLLEEYELHLIVSDILMPGMSGLDLLTFVKSMHKDVAMVMATRSYDCHEPAKAGLDAVAMN